MIAKITRYPDWARSLIQYLYDIGPAADPHIIAGWRTPAELEPSRRNEGGRDFRQLGGLLEQPVAALGSSRLARPLWHCVIRAAPEDRPLSDGEWAQIASDVMDRTGLSRHGGEDDGVRWVAIRRGDDRIHVVATLARHDGAKPNLSGEHYRVRDACRAAEERYGLRRTTPAPPGAQRDIAARDYPVSVAGAIQAGRRVSRRSAADAAPPSAPGGGARAAGPAAPSYPEERTAMNVVPAAGNQGRLLTALDDLGNIAERAAQAWAGRLTIRQGYDITVMLGSSLDRLGAVADDLRRYRLTDQTGLAAGPAADAVSEISEASRRIMGGRAALIIPDKELPWTSIGYSEPVHGYRVRHGGPPGGDPARDGTGVRAAHLVLLAAHIAADSSPDLQGETDDRDEIVFHLMSALDGLGLAIPNLARGAPDPPFLSALAKAAACLDQAFGHLREYLIFSAAAATHLDIGELGENMRHGIQLRAERERASAAASGRGPVGLAAASFPGSLGDTTAASPEPETSEGPPSATWHRPHGRHARPPRGNR